MARSVLLKLTADPSDAKRGVDDVKDDLKKFDGFTAEAKAEIKTQAATAQLDKLHKQLKRLGSQESTPEVKIRTARVVSQIEKIENELDRAVTKPRRMRIIGDRLGEGGPSRAGAAAAAGSLVKSGAAVTAVAAIGAGAFSAKAAIDAEQAQARLRAQLKASGVAWDENAEKIDRVIQRTSKLAGLDDEDLQDAFVALLRGTGDVNLSLKSMATVADLARAKHMDLAKAGETIAKVHAGNLGPLKRLGISLFAETVNSDKLKKKIADLRLEREKAKGPEKDELARRIQALQAQKGEAKELDAKATAVTGFAMLQKRLAGQAERYGKTTQGSIDRTMVALENLGEVVGAELTPAIRALADFIPKIGPAFRDAIKAIRSFGGTRQIFKGFGQSIKGLVQLVKGLLHGEWGEVWRGFKNIVSGNIKTMLGYLKNMLVPFKAAGKKIGEAIKSGLSSALAGIKVVVYGAINIVIDAINKLIKAANKADILDVVPEIPRIGRLGESKGGVKLKDREPSRGKAGGDPAGRFKSRLAPNLTVNVSTPGGGSPDPRVLADQLGRELRRRGG